MRYLGVLVALMAVGLLGSEASALTVTTTSDANTLATNIVGAGVSTSNPVYSADTTGGSGTFTGGIASGIGIDSGIILTTGTAAGAVGPNNSDSFSGPGRFSRLNFDFTTTTGSVFFNYVFASEEYNEFTNSQFNDSFTLQVDGVNVAIIPGTSTEVTINTVNGGNPFGASASHPEFFHNNDLQDGGPFFNIQYDGFTSVFTAQATGLNVNTSHTMSFFITDIGDPSFDSAVFVQGGSFSVTPPEPPPPTGVPAPTTLMLLGFGLIVLAGGVLRRRAERRPPS